MSKDDSFFKAFRALVIKVLETADSDPINKSAQSKVKPMFQPGDCVQLKCGGQVMVVQPPETHEQLDHSFDEVRVTWFNGTGLCSKWMHVSILQPAQ